LAIACWNTIPTKQVGPKAIGVGLSDFDPTRLRRVEGIPLPGHLYKSMFIYTI
jgi:hypothetical protein